MDSDRWYSWSGKDLFIHVLIQARAKQDGPGKIHNNRLKIQIKAPPIAGRANRYLTGYLADEFKISKSGIEIIKGHLSKNKMIKIRDPKTLPRWFCDLIQSDNQNGA